jgi:hypothetical protein
VKKPERIYNFDSGWSIDLDRVVGIGKPEYKSEQIWAFAKINVCMKIWLSLETNTIENYVLYEKENTSMIDPKNIIEVNNFTEEFRKEISKISTDLNQAWIEWINYKESLR